MAAEEVNTAVQSMLPNTKLISTSASFSAVEAISGKFHTFKLVFYLPHGQTFARG